MKCVNSKILFGKIWFWSFGNSVNWGKYEDSWDSSQKKRKLVWEKLNTPFSTWNFPSRNFDLKKVVWIWVSKIFFGHNLSRIQSYFFLVQFWMKTILLLILWSKNTYIKLINPGRGARDFVFIYRKTSLEITSFCISDVPSPMVQSLASR